MEASVIPVMKPKLVSLASSERYFRRIEETRSYSNSGPLLREGEDRIAQLLGTEPENVVLCASATVAIEWAIRSSGFSDVQVPAYTFAATGLAALNAGANIMFSDVDCESGLLKLQTANKHVLPIVVAPFGAPIQEEMFLGARKGILDAAASLGNTIDNGLVLPGGWVAIFSLHATKVLGIGEGGLAVFGDRRWADDFRSRINFGYVDGRIGSKASTNGKLSEFGAALLLATLDVINDEREDWLLAQALAKRYFSHPKISRFDRGAGFHPYVVARVSEFGRAALLTDSLRRRDIETRRWWAEPLPNLSAFRVSERYPIADQLANSLIGLPMFRGLSSAEADRIASALEDSLQD